MIKDDYLNIQYYPICTINQHCEYNHQFHHGKFPFQDPSDQFRKISRTAGFNQNNSTQSKETSILPLLSLVNINLQSKYTVNKRQRQRGHQHLSVQSKSIIANQISKSPIGKPPKKQKSKIRRKKNEEGKESIVDIHQNLSLDQDSKNDLFGLQRLNKLKYKKREQETENFGIFQLNILEQENCLHSIKSKRQTLNQRFRKQDSKNQSIDLVNWQSKQLQNNINIKKILY